MTDAEDLIDGLAEIFGLDGPVFEHPTEISKAESADDE